MISVANNPIKGGLWYYKYYINNVITVVVPSLLLDIMNEPIRGQHFRMPYPSNGTRILTEEQDISRQRQEGFYTCWS